MKRSIFLAVSAAVLALSGCSKNSDADTIKIGGVAPLSGDVAVYGVECKNGIDLAVEEINAAGGVNGKKLAFICEDDEGDAARKIDLFIFSSINKM